MRQKLKHIMFPLLFSVATVAAVEWQLWNYRHAHDVFEDAKEMAHAEANLAARTPSLYADER